MFPAFIQILDSVDFMGVLFKKVHGYPIKEHRENMEIKLITRQPKIIFFLMGILFSLSSTAVFSQVRDSLAPVGALIYPKERNSITYDSQRREYDFTYQDENDHLQYTIRASDPLIGRGLIHLRVTVDQRSRILPIHQGGLFVRDATGVTSSPVQMAEKDQCKLISHTLEGDTVHFLFSENIGSATLQKQFSYRMSGKTLIMRVSASAVPNATSGYVGFDFGRSRFTLAPKVYTLPTCPVPVIRTGKEFFMTTYVDPVLSNAGRYAETIQILNSRTVQASNTPAWLLQLRGGIIPSLDMTAYVTVSKLLEDVAPMPPANTSSEADTNKKVVLALNELPFSYRPIQPVEIIRRWESPTSGVVHLKGTFTLEGRGKVNCEVRFLDQSEQKIHSLFNQQLDSTTKPSTGIKGEFPLAKGDQLMFACSGPAVMTGGEVIFRVQLYQEDEWHDSFYDFSRYQGGNGWYYEQKIGQETTLLLWNPANERWESQQTRSFQLADRMVCRRGKTGDAFEAAEKFLDEIHSMGLENIHYILSGWSDFARISPPPDMDRSELIWGSATTLKRVSEMEINRGNTISDVISYHPERQKAIAALSESTTAKKLVMEDDYILYARENLSSHWNKMNFEGLVVQDLPSLDNTEKFLIPGKVGNHYERSSRVAVRRLKEIVNAIQNMHKKDLVQWRDDPIGLADLSVYSQSAGLIAPTNPESDIRTIIDVDSFSERKDISKIGFGTYGQFFQRPNRFEHIDLRLMPFDYYLTSIIVFGRIPYLSDAIWYPGITARDIRCYLLETLSLLQPVAEEYLQARNSIDKIVYFDSDSTEYDVEELLFESDPEKITRTLIKYSNGLRIYANRDSSPWRVKEKIVENVEVDQDGFLAINNQTGLASMIGQLSSRRFSVASAGNSIFLHSRDGKLLSIPPITTNGMIKTWESTVEKRHNFTYLKATEALWSENFLPILRTNEHIDCTIQWRDANRVEIRIFEAGNNHPMLEFFELPTEWFDDENGTLSVWRKKVGGDEFRELKYWSIIPATGRSGIRISDLENNDIYLIRYEKETSP